MDYLREIQAETQSCQDGTKSGHLDHKLAFAHREAGSNLGECSRVSVALTGPG